MNASSDVIEYRPIPGFLGYRAGNDGSIWSCWKRGTGSQPCSIWKRLNPGTKDRGYRYVGLKCGGKILYRHVHQLVLIAFVGPCPDGMECAHEDGDTSNNMLSNLRWATHTGNEGDKVGHGTSPTGARHGKAKLDDEVVRTIRADYATGLFSQAALGLRHNVSQTLIGAIVRRKLWKHVA